MSDTYDKKKEARVSLMEFFVKYKLFVITMTGVLMVGVCHAMSENCFIAIFQSLGGGSEDVGMFFMLKTLLLILAIFIAFVGILI